MGKVGAIMDSSSGMKNNDPRDEKGKNIEMFYPAQSERSRANIANISQHDDSINFSNLESSIAPSYNDSINKQGREKQY